MYKYIDTRNFVTLSVQSSTSCMSQGGAGPPDCHWTGHYVPGHDFYGLLAAFGVSLEAPPKQGPF